MLGGKRLFKALTWPNRMLAFLPEADAQMLYFQWNLGGRGRSIAAIRLLARISPIQSILEQE